MVCESCKNMGEWDSREATDEFTNPKSTLYQLEMGFVEGSTLAEKKAITWAAKENLTTQWWVPATPEEEELVRIFLQDYEDGDIYDDKFLRVFAIDMAGELKLMRGWCPHRQAWRDADQDPWYAERNDSASI